MAEAHSVLLFDTQQAVEELVAAGMPPEQARVIVRQQARWIDRDFATGEDIDRLEAEIGRLRQEFGGQLGQLREEFGGQLGQLREEFDQKLEAQGAAIAKDMDHLREGLEQRIDARYESLDHKLNVQRSALETKITQSSADTIRWVTGSQIGTAAVYLAALLAAIKL